VFFKVDSDILEGAHHKERCQVVEKVGSGSESALYDHVLFCQAVAAWAESDEVFRGIGQPGIGEFFEGNDVVHVMCIPAFPGPAMLAAKNRPFAGRSG
jgi:hypothetical protein